MAKTTDTLVKKGESDEAKWVFPSIFCAGEGGQENCSLVQTDWLFARSERRTQMQLQSSWDPWVRWRKFLRVEPVILAYLERIRGNDWVSDSVAEGGAFLLEGDPGYYICSLLLLADAGAEQ